MDTVARPDDLNATTSEVLKYFSDLLSNIYHKDKSQYISCFKSLTGLACLCSEISLVNENKRHYLFKILEAVLSDQRLVAKMVAADLQRAITLFCGSKILAATSQDRTYDCWICSGDNYSQWLINQLCELSSIPPLMLDKAFKLGYPKSIFEVTMTEKNWSKFIESYQKLSNTSKRFILSSFLRSTTLSPPAIATLWAHMSYGDVYSMLKLAQQFSTSVQRAVVIWPNKQQLFTATKQLLHDWASPISMSQLSIPQQTAQTQLIIGCSSQLDPEQLLDLSRLPEFSNGITERLSSDSERIREMGTIVGQVVARKAGKSLDFGIEYQNRYFFAIEEIMDISLALEMSDPIEVENLIDEFLISEEAATTEIIGDSDDEDSEDEDSLSLVYIRDLIKYLESTDYLKHHMAMKKGADLVLQKAHFGEEVRQYAPRVLELVAGISDKYNIQDFSHQRQQILEAILVADPPMAEEVSKLLNGGDYSLYQRTSLMNALVGAAKTLSGYKPKSFASERLAIPQLHNAFYSPADALAISVKKQLIGGENASDQLDKKYNMYSRVAARYYFYPLANAVPKNYGTYTLLVYQHWIRTLALLLFFSFPCNDMGDMVSKLLRIMMAARNTAAEGVFTCILILCDVAPGILVQHIREVSELNEWCSNTWPQLKDPEDQKLGAGANYKLSKLLQDMEQKFINGYA